MGRSRSRSCGRHIPPSVYCKKKKKRRHGRKRSRCGSRRKSRRRSRRSRCGSRRRSRHRSRSRRKRCRPGRKTNNPFLNYLRVFRKKHCGWPQCKIAIEGAKCWCKMSSHDRKKYYNQACSMRKKGKGRRRRGKKRRGRSRCGKRRKSRRRRKSCNTCPK